MREQRHSYKSCLQKWQIRFFTTCAYSSYVYLQNSCDSKLHLLSAFPPMTSKIRLLAMFQKKLFAVLERQIFQSSRAKKDHEITMPTFSKSNVCAPSLR